MIGENLSLFTARGVFALCTVTKKFIMWSTLPLLICSASDPERAEVFQAETEGYHHLVNPLPV